MVKRRLDQIAAAPSLVSSVIASAASRCSIAFTRSAAILSGVTMKRLRQQRSREMIAKVTPINLAH